MGENHKTYKLIKSVSQATESFISNINENYRFIKFIAGKADLIFELIREIMNTLNDDKLMQVSALERCSKFSIFEKTWNFEYNDLLKDNYRYWVYIYSKEEVSRMIPMINSINCKNSSVHSFNWINNYLKLWSNLEYNSIWVFNENGTIKFKMLENKAFNMNVIKKSKNKCQKIDWWCKPKRVYNIGIENIDRLHSEIELGNISKNANRFMFCERLYNFYPIDSNIINSLLIENLRKFFGLFEINKQSSIETSIFIISDPTVIGEYSKFAISQTEFLLFFDRNIYTVNWWGDARFNGLFYISDNYTIAALKLAQMETKGLVIKRQEDTFLSNPKWFDELKDKFPADRLGLYVIVRKYDITEFASRQLESIKKASAFEKVKEIQINTTESDYEKKELINTLKVLQKNLTLKIEWRADSWFLMDECFWIELFKFNQIEFINEGYWKMCISCIGQELDQSDILKSIIEAYSYLYRLKIPIYQVIDIISITEIEFKYKYSSLPDDDSSDSSF